MKVIEALKIQSILDNREIPCDMHDELTYYSESQDKYIKVHDMDITHLVRAFLKVLNSSLACFKISSVLIESSSAW